MAKCERCGQELNWDDKVCPACGTEVSAAEKTNADFSYTVDKFVSTVQNTEDETAFYDANDIAQNKLMGILAYLGILVVIPLFAAPRSPYARFHTNQGLVLFVANAVFQVVQNVAVKILKAILPDFIGGLVGALLSLVGLMFFVLMILGIVNVVGGKAKKLPFIGHITLVKPNI